MHHEDIPTIDFIKWILHMAERREIIFQSSQTDSQNLVQHLKWKDLRNIWINHLIFLHAAENNPLFLRCDSLAGKVKKENCLTRYIVSICPFNKNIMCILSSVFLYLFDLNLFISWVSKFTLISLVSWHINHYRLFNAKSGLYIYIKYIGFGLIGFYGISTIAGYLMPKTVYTYILSK